MVNVVEKTNKNRNLLKTFVFLYNTYYFSNDVIFIERLSIYRDSLSLVL